MHFCQLYNQWLNLGVIMAYIQRSWWHPTPVLLPGKSHGQRSLVGCSPWGHKKSDTTEWLPFHFSLSCTGEGNGNPLSCLENPRDGGAWWAAVYGIAQSQTRLKWLSSSSSSSSRCRWMHTFKWLILCFVNFSIWGDTWWKFNMNWILNDIVELWIFLGIIMVWYSRKN